MSEDRGRRDYRFPGTESANARPEESVGQYAGIGFQFAAAILLFTFVGYWLDGKLGTSPWLLILGMFVGAAGGFYSIYRKLMGDQERYEAARKKK
jgi:F0F1-type ATP synthase assembly protein I